MARSSVSTARSCPIAAEAATPCPTTSPTTSATLPSASGIASNQSPPADCSCPAAWYRAAILARGSTGRAAGSSASCSSATIPRSAGWLRSASAACCWAARCWAARCWAARCWATRSVTSVAMTSSPLTVPSAARRGTTVKSAYTSSRPPRLSGVSGLSGVFGTSPICARHSVLVSGCPVSYTRSSMSCSGCPAGPGKASRYGTPITSGLPVKARYAAFIPARR